MNFESDDGFVISIDPGTTKAGVALFDLSEQKLDSVHTIKGLGYELDVKDKIEKALAEIVWDKCHRHVGSSIVLIELPAARYYGRPAVPIIKVLHQIVYMVQALSRWAEGVILVDSFDWNFKAEGKKGRQYTDKEKEGQFLEAFPQYQPRQTNSDERDAALMGLWFIQHHAQLLLDDYVT
jgi:hypothetical protein